MTKILTKELDARIAKAQKRRGAKTRAEVIRALLFSALEKEGSA